MHTANIGLVGDVARQDLEGNREAEALGRQRGLLYVGCLHGLDRWDAKCRKQIFGLRFGEDGAAVIEHRIDDCCGLGRVNRDEIRYRGWRLHQEFLVSPISHQVPEGLNGLFRRFVGGNLVDREEPPRCGCRGFAEPTRERRAPSCPERFDNSFRGIEAIGDCRRTVHDEDGIAFRVFEQCLEALRHSARPMRRPEYRQDCPATKG